MQKRYTGLEKALKQIAKTYKPSAIHQQLDFSQMVTVKK